MKILQNAPVKSIILDRVNTFNGGNFVFNNEDLTCEKLIRQFLECKEKKVFVFKPNSRKELSYFYNLIPYLSDCIIGVDEVALEGNSRGFYSESLHDLIHFGRHKTVGFIGTSQRIRNIPHSFISQCDIIFSFRQSDLNDRMFLQGHLDTNKLIDYPLYKYLSFPDDINLKDCYKRRDN